jgi:hypothetical protein
MERKKQQVRTSDPNSGLISYLQKSTCFMHLHCIQIYISIPHYVFSLTLKFTLLVLDLKKMLIFGSSSSLICFTPIRVLFHVLKLFFTVGGRIRPVPEVFVWGTCKYKTS